MTEIVERSIGPDGEVFADRRAGMRWRVFKQARLTFGNGTCSLVGIVRNRSHGGARLSFGDVCAMPSAFRLEISGEPGSHAAEVRWRTLSDVGVAIEDDQAAR